jgi:hypothetical protein
VERSSLVSSEISSDQVKNGGEYYIGKRFNHLTLSIGCSCLYFLSDELFYGLTQGYNVDNMFDYKLA